MCLAGSWKLVSRTNSNSVVSVLYGLIVGDHFISICTVYIQYRFCVPVTLSLFPVFFVYDVLITFCSFDFSHSVRNVTLYLESLFIRISSAAAAGSHSSFASFNFNFWVLTRSTSPLLFPFSLQILLTNTGSPGSVAQTHRTHLICMLSNLLYPRGLQL